MIDHVLNETLSQSEVADTVGTISLSAGSDSYSVAAWAGKTVRLLGDDALTLVRGTVTVADKVGFYMATALTPYEVYIPDDGVTTVSVYNPAGTVLVYAYVA